MSKSRRSGKCDVCCRCPGSFITFGFFKFYLQIPD